MLTRPEPPLLNASAQATAGGLRHPPSSFDGGAIAPEPLDFARLHRRFHGRWSAFTLAVGVVVNLGGLMGLGGVILRS